MPAIPGLAEVSNSRCRTKIVATVGPACDSIDSLQKLVDAGVDVFRINTAHGTEADHDRVLATINRVRESRRPVGVLVDLAGPKIRLGELLKEPTHLQVGSQVRFVRGTDSQTEWEFTSNYPGLIDDLRVGDRVMLTDGTVALSVAKTAAAEVVCTVLNDGWIRSRQGINLPGVRISMPTLTEHDKRCAAWAAKAGVDFVSLSFVRTADDVRELRELLASHGCRAPIVAKIEKPEALENLDEIVRATDAVMVARGDLGVEIDVAEVPAAQKRIVAKCNRLQRPVIVATQMLDSMQEDPRPTRAEASDVANAILDGADACMLSGETAVGKYPIKSVEMMNRIMIATEKLLKGKKSNPPVHEADSVVLPITQSVVYGAAGIARHVHAKLVVIVTRNGTTAIAKASQRDYIPTVAVSESLETLRRISLLWGVTPLAGAPVDNSQELRDFIGDWGKREGTLSTGDCVVIVTGTKVPSGAHNVVFVHRMP